ncbi:MAG: NfeD family protein [Proteobacteria bacterium]|nr:NfeD family protein [Pseudomonadota bacterium]
MSDWMIWAVLALGVAILELFTGTFYLLMIAIGLAAAALAAMFGMGFSVQLIVAAVVGVIATYVLYNSKLGKIQKTDAARDPNVNLDIGQTLNVAEWKDIPGGQPVARVMYRGAMWDVELATGATVGTGQFVINELRGNRLIVTNNSNERRN